MNGDQMRKSEKNNGRNNSAESQKKLIMQKIYESEIYKEFIQQWGNAENRPMVMEKVWINKER